MDAPLHLINIKSQLDLRRLQLEDIVAYTEKVIFTNIELKFSHNRTIFCVTLV